MSQATHQPGSNVPALTAYRVPNGRNAPWIRIGAAWPHQNGVGFSLKIEMLPLEVLTAGSLNIRLRKPKSRYDDAAEAAGAGNLYP